MVMSIIFMDICTCLCRRLDRTGDILKHCQNSLAWEEHGCRLLQPSVTSPIVQCLFWECLSLMFSMMILKILSFLRIGARVGKHVV